MAVHPKPYDPLESFRVEVLVHPDISCRSSSMLHCCLKVDDLKQVWQKLLKEGIKSKEAKTIIDLADKAGVTLLLPLKSWWELR